MIRNFYYEKIEQNLSLYKNVLHKGREECIIEYVLLNAESYSYAPVRSTCK